MRTAGLLGSVVLLLVVGCTTYYRNYSNPSADFQRDLYECRRENSHPAAAVVGSYGSAGVEVNEGMARQCMAARGWREVSESEARRPHPGQVSPPAPASSSRPPSMPACAFGMYWSSAEGKCTPFSESSGRPASMPPCPYGTFWSTVSNGCIKIGE